MYFLGIPFVLVNIPRLEPISGLNLVSILPVHTVHDFSRSKKVNRVSSLFICLGKERIAFDTTLILKQQKYCDNGCMRIIFMLLLLFDHSSTGAMKNHALPSDYSTPCHL